MFTSTWIFEQMRATIRAKKIDCPRGKWQPFIHGRFLVSTRLHVSGYDKLLILVSNNSRSTEVDVMMSYEKLVMK